VLAIRQRADREEQPALAKVGENRAREVRHLVEVADLDEKFFVDCSGREPHCRRTFRLQPLPFVDVREKRGGSSQTAPNTRSNVVVDLEIESVDCGMYGTMVACNSSELRQHNRAATLIFLARRRCVLWAAAVSGGIGQLLRGPGCI
jgi:hypothetical protein